MSGEFKLISSDAHAARKALDGFGRGNSCSHRWSETHVDAGGCSGSGEMLKSNFVLLWEGKKVSQADKAEEGSLDTQLVF